MSYSCFLVYDWEFSHLSDLGEYSDFKPLNRSKLINTTINWQTLKREKCTGVSRAGERQNCHWFNRIVASYHTRLKYVTFVSCCWGRRTCTHACAGESWKLLTYHSILLISVCSLVLLCSEIMDDSVTLSPLNTLESEEKQILNQILTLNNINRQRSSTKPCHNKKFPSRRTLFLVIRWLKVYKLEANL